jgi:hypothetical protein
MPPVLGAPPAEPIDVFDEADESDFCRAGAVFELSPVFSAAGTLLGP